MKANTNIYSTVRENQQIQQNIPADRRLSINYHFLLTFHVTL